MTVGKRSALNMEKFIGVTIGSGKIKSVLLGKDKKSVVLEDFRSVELPPDGGENKKGLLLDGLRKALEGYDTKRTRVICSTDSMEVQNINLVLPLLAPDEMREAVAWEIKNQASIAKKDSVFDYV